MDITVDKLCKELIADIFAGMKMSTMEETPSHVNAFGYIPPYSSLHTQVS